MASRTNKFSSLNFNDIFDKQKNNITSSLTSPSSKSQSLSSANKSYSFSASTSRHGGMLVLSRPTSSSSTHKPPPSPPLSPSPLNLPPSSPPPKPASDPTHSHADSISLRPQGKTGSPSSPFPTLDRVPKDPPSPASAPPLSPRSDKFVPPHLRPGFVALVQKPVPPELQRPVGGGDTHGNFRPNSAHGYYGSPKRNGEDGRPKSGGGGRMRGYGDGDGDSDAVGLSRSRSVGYNGYRPSSSG